MTLGGSTESTFTGRAARAKSASIEISIPGASTPPTYSPAADTTSKFVAVPKSTTMHGGPYRSTAEIELTIRSGPTSRGSSVRTGMPVRTPGPTTSRLAFVNRRGGGCGFRGGGGGGGEEED